MKAILTLTMMLGLLVTFASADSPAEGLSKDLITEQHEKNIELCTQNLVAIGKAVEAYKKEHGDFPKWLSELHPKYLSEANLLLCPADEESGKPLFSSNADPKMPVSYDYQFHPENRAEKNEERLVYGDAIPLIRCFHHLNEDLEGERLNLGFSLNIYKSLANWKYLPEDMYGSPEAAITAFENALAQHPDDRRFFDLHPMLVVLYTKVGDEQSADAMIERLKSGTVPDIQGYRMVLRILGEAKLYEELLGIFKAAEQQYQQHPDEGRILVRLAYIYEKLGNVELAEVYHRKSDPKYELWGKPVTDFSATDLDGKPISLQDYCGKVVLLDFWAVWCAPCIAEMPNLKRVYTTYKDQGFDIIGVSLDDEESVLRDYLTENDIQWRQIFDNARGEDSLVRQYNIHGIPEPWLIDRNGKLITHKARAEKLEQLVVEALKDKSANR